MERIRTVRLGPFTVHVYDLYHTDEYGKPALGYRILQKGRGVVAEDFTREGAVYCGAGTPTDSDSSVASLIQLVCHHVQHDSDDNPVACPWDAENLSDLASMRWEDM